MNRYLQLAILILIAGMALFLIPHKPQAPVTNTEQQQPQNGETFQPEVILDQPQYGDLVTSPMHVSGRVRGNWMFEGNLPMMLKDSDGKVLYQKGYQVPEGTNWMTTDFVPFSTDITFDPPATDYGVLIISKDNPSGNPDNDSSYAVPVKFR